MAPGAPANTAMLKQITIEDLRPGMYISEVCDSWVDHTLWRTRFTCQNDADVLKVRRAGVRTLKIDTDKGADVVDSRVIALIAERERARAEAELAQAERSAREGKGEHRVSFQEEAYQAQKVLVQSRKVLSALFTDVRSGAHIDIDAAGEVVDGVQASVGRNPGTLIGLARLRAANDYTYLHAVACSAMMTGLARQLGMDEKQVRTAGLAGLLLDVGKALIPAAILNKPGELDEAEFQVMRSHPDKGHEYLCSIGITDRDLLDVCLHHHERADGSGYPHGLQGEAFGTMARMGAICDVYDAITTSRSYKKEPGMTPAEAIRKMAEWAPAQFDPRIFQAFVKTMGIYPVGSTVQLACGRLGVVVENHEHDLLRPKVKVFFSTQSKVRLAPELIDLAVPGTQNRILARVNPSDYGLTKVDYVWAAEALASLRPRGSDAVQ